MLNIKRLQIKGGQGHCGDKVYPFVRDILKRRYGNSVTFCFDWEMNNIINQFKEAGFTAYDDNYNVKITEPKDYEKGKIVYLEGMLGDIPMLVKELKDDVIHGRIVKVKYVNYPKKHGVWVKVKTKDILEGEILKYGEGMFQAFKNKIEKEAI